MLSTVSLAPHGVVPQDAVVMRPPYFERPTRRVICSARAGATGKEPADESRLSRTGTDGVGHRRQYSQGGARSSRLETLAWKSTTSCSPRRRAWRHGHAG